MLRSGAGGLRLTEAGFAWLLALPVNRGKGAVVNIGSGRGVSLRELISLLTQILEKPIEVDYKPSRDFDVHTNVLDITRARKILDWRPKISFEEGLSRHIAYLKQQLV